MPVIVYKNFKDLLEFSVTMIDGVKRNILEMLSRAALPSRVVAEYLDLPPEVVQGCLKQLVDSGLVVVLATDKQGQKYYSAVTPILRDVDIKELEPGLKKLANNFYKEFVEKITQNQALVEEVFAKNGGRYTLGRVLEYAGGNVMELMYKKIQKMSAEENKRIIENIASRE